MIDGLQSRRVAGRANIPNIFHRRQPKKAAVFAIELARTFVAYRESRTGGIDALDKHALPSRLQTKLFLVLQWAHGSQNSEVVMQRGGAHSGDVRQILHP